MRRIAAFIAPSITVAEDFGRGARSASPFGLGKLVFWGGGVCEIGTR